MAYGVRVDRPERDQGKDVAKDAAQPLEEPRPTIPPGTLSREDKFLAALEATGLISSAVAIAMRAGLTKAGMLRVVEKQWGRALVQRMESRFEDEMATHGFGGVQ